METITTNLGQTHLITTEPETNSLLGLRLHSGVKLIMETITTEPETNLSFGL